jgi:tetratricopeptide (TPR) repeat protein
MEFNYTGYILWFDSERKYEKKLEFSNIRSFIEIVKKDFPEYPIGLQIYKSIGSFNIESFKDTSKLLYVVVSSQELIFDVLEYFRDKQQIKRLIVYSTSEKVKSKVTKQYEYKQVVFVSTAVSLSITLQQLIRPELSILKYGRRNTITQPVTNLFRSLSNIDDDNFKIIICNFKREIQKYYLYKSFSVLDSDNYEYNICEVVANDEVSKKSKLVEETLRPLSISYNPDKHFQRFKSDVLNTFGSNKLAAIKELIDTYYLPELEKCNNLKDLCLKFVHQYVFCESKFLMEEINKAFRNIDNFALVEDLKYLMIAILLAFNKDYHFESVNQTVYHDTFMKYNERIKKDLTIYSNQVVQALPNSIIKHGSKKKKLKEVLQERNTLIEFDFENAKTDLFFYNVIWVSNIATSKTKKTIQTKVALLSPLTKFIINNIQFCETYTKINLVPMNNDFSFMHCLYNFTYNITLENSLDYMKEKKLRKLCYKLRALIENYHRQLKMFETKDILCDLIINSQKGILNLYCQEYEDAIQDYQRCRDLFKPYIKSIYISPLFLAEQYCNLGRCYYYLGDWDKFFELVQNSLRIYKDNKIKYILDRAQIYGLLGNYYEKEAQNPEAMKYYNKELKIARILYPLEDNIYLARVYNRLGNLFYENDSYNFAIEYFKKDLSITEKLLGDHSIETAISYTNLATVYEFIDLNSTALELCEKGQKILTEIKQE